MPCSTQYRSFQRCSSRPISCLVLKKLNLTQQKQTFIKNTTILQHHINANKNSSGDEKANVNFYAVRPRSYPNSLKYRKIRAITPFKEMEHLSPDSSLRYRRYINHLLTHLLTQGHLRSPILIPMESSYATSD